MISTYRPIKPPGGGDLEARYSSRSLLFPYFRYGALIVVQGYIGANNVQRQGQGHYPNASTCRTIQQPRPKDGISRMVLGSLLWILGFHILSHISHNLNVLVQLWKIGRQLIRPPCANSLSTFPDFHLASVRW